MGCIVADFDIKSIVRRYHANLGEAYDLAVDCRMTLIGIECGGKPLSPTSRYEAGRFDGLLEGLASVLASRMRLDPKALPRFKGELRRHINKEAIRKRGELARTYARKEVG